MNKEDKETDKKDNETAFEELDSESGIVGEFWEFLKYNKKFWLIPILIILLVLGLIIFLGGTSAAPFIYTLF